LNALLTAQHLTKRFGSKTAVHDFDLSVNKGEIMGLLGPNGAGKTTTIKMLCGLLRTDRGVICYEGKPLRHFATVAKKIGILLEPAFAGYLTGRDVLTMIARLRGIKEAGAEVDRVLEFVDLSGAKHKRVSGYSFGMRIRLGLAAALLGRPDLLILDEPTVGLDPLGQAAFMERLRAFRAEGGTVLFSSHRLEEIRALCDRVTYIRDGELQLVATTNELDRTDEFRLQIQAGSGLSERPFAWTRSVERDGETAWLTVSRADLSHALTELIHAGHQIVDVREGRSALWQVFQEGERS
jgi:ABC-2 type transport system ATP-binding protein